MSRVAGGTTAIPRLAFTLTLAVLAVTSPVGLAETWSGTVTLESSVEVPGGEVLVLEEGTTLAPASGSQAELVVRGSLLVNGSVDEPVVVRVPIRAVSTHGSLLLVQNASLHPDDKARCALAAHPAVAGRIDNASLEGADNGLCLPPAPTGRAPPASRAAEEGSPGRNRAGGASLSPDVALPLAEQGETGGDPRNLFAGVDAGLDLRSVRAADHSHAGVNLSGLAPRLDAPAVQASNLTLVGNGIGIHARDEAARLEVSGATLADNDVGILASGGRVQLDHARFHDNERWDVRQTTAPSTVTWSGSFVEPTCSQIDDRPSRGCTRGAISASTLTLILGLVYSLVFLVSEAGRYLLVRVGVGLGLYSRIPRDELLEEETRRELFALLEGEPGLHLREIVREMDAGYGRIAYHLARLEKADFVTSQREGVYRRFYARDDGPGDREPRSTRDEVLEVIRQEPGIYAAEIARELGTSRQLVTYHVRELVGLAKVEERRGKNCKRLFPAES